jgi:poly-beta-1,6-N-acetyl-D-glucosamine synthase
MISFYLIWIVCYFVLLSMLMKKWPDIQPGPNLLEYFPTVTLLIPFRNEQENLANLTEELLKLSYPSLEIILVDDQSEDGSFSFFKGKFKSDSRIKILQSSKIGKKKAIELGVQSAEGELVICSDADCRFPKGWVERMVEPFSIPKIQLVAGPVISEGQSNFFQRFQQIEWSSILLLTQFFFIQNRPLMCSGANIVYRKSAFLEVNGYDQNSQYLSGDDEFLLKKISARYGKESCIYLPFLENLVFTRPQKSFFDLLNQRVRWAGKWKLHRDAVHALSAAISFSAQLIWLASFLLLGLGEKGVLIFCMVWTVKILSERMALGKVLQISGLRFSIFDFIKTGSPILCHFCSPRIFGRKIRLERPCQLKNP